MPSKKSRNVNSDTSSIVVSLRLSGSKKNQAKVRAALRECIATAIRENGYFWTYIGKGRVEIDWLVLIKKTHAN